MKLSSETLDILKNFSYINKNIMIRKGNVVRTMSPSKTIVGKAVIDEEFPQDLAIYDLNRFLNTYNLFEDADILFSDNHLVIASGESRITYSYADPSILVIARDQDLKLGNVVTTVSLSSEVFSAVEKARKTLGLEDIAIEGDGSSLRIRALDSSGKTKDNYSLVLGDTDKNFKAVFKAENMEFIKQNYEVSISSNGLSHWVGDKVEYWAVMLADHSKF